MSILQRENDFKRLSQLMPPSVAMRDDQNILRWLDTFTDPEIEYASTRTRKTFMFLPQAETIVIYKYVTGVMVNQRKTNAAGGAL
jgi:hypothetical protein